MLKKEFRDIIKPTLIIMCVLLVIPFLLTLNPDWLISGFQEKSGLMAKIGASQHFVLFIIALIITFTSGGFGSGIFKSEQKDRAFEYLFSSPVSKVKMIILKVVPRLIALILFLVVYILIFLSHTNNEIHNSITNSIFLNPKLFFVWIIFIFFISFFPSIFKQKNWIAITSLVTLISIFLLPVAIKTVLVRSEFQFVNPGNIRVLSFITGMFIVFIISATAFFFAYKNFDLKEQSFKGNKFVLISLIPQIVLMVISIFIFIYK